VHRLKLSAGRIMSAPIKRRSRANAAAGAVTAAAALQ